MDDLIILRLVILGSAGLLLVIGAFIDIRRFIIPNWLNVSLLVLGVVFAALTPSFSWVTNLATAIAVFLSGAIFYQFRLFGGGDVKLLAVLSFWAGLPNLFSLFFIMALSGGVLSIVYLLKSFFQRRSEAGRLSLAESATLLHSDMAEGGGAAVLQRARSSDVFRQPIPYGVAIAVGGLYVLISIVGQLG
jgi:Flp pilus assembly protein protease CpaA